MLLLIAVDLLLFFRLWVYDTTSTPSCFVVVDTCLSVFELLCFVCCCVALTHAFVHYVVLIGKRAVGGNRN